MARRSFKQCEALVQRIYASVYKKVFTKSNLSAAVNGNRSIIESELLRLSLSDKYNEFCKQFAKKLAKAGLSNHRGVWRKYFEAAKKNQIIAISYTYSKFQKDILKKLIDDNFSMIKSIPQSIMKMYRHKFVDVLFDQTAIGSLSRGSFERQLRRHGAKNAKMIARTETAKLQTAIDRISSTKLGSPCYFWRATKDHRTRQSHKSMEGVIVFWQDSQDNKPLLDNMHGDAGEFPNCRCDVEPIFDERDLTKSTYLVYDYRKHKPVRMSKHAVLDLMDAGGFN